MNFINLKSLKSFSYVLFVLVLGVFTSCGGSGRNSNSSKDITAFTIPSQVGTTIITDTSATEGTIAVTMPFGTVVTGLVATFTTAGSSVAVGTTPQVSGTTANNFTSPVTYTVTAADTTTMAYIVTVTPTPVAAGDKVTFTADGVSFKMAYVPGGLTCPTTSYDDSGPSATVNDAYWIGETEVTWELWKKVYDWATTVASPTYTFANPGLMGSVSGGTGMTNQHPVTTINWRDAMIWANALTEWYNYQNHTHYTCAYHTNSGYTSPLRHSTNNAVPSPLVSGLEDAPYIKTDATGFRMLKNNEWEIAARYKDGTNWTLGNYASGATDYAYNNTSHAANTNMSPTKAVAWYSDNSDSKTHIVGTAGNPSLTPNPFSGTSNALGLYDVSGNVWEWSFDWYTSGSDRVVRGGSWGDVAGDMQLGGVDYYSPYDTYNVIGFRLSRTDL